MKAHAERLAALGQETRLAIFRLLVQAGPAGRCVEEIRRAVGLPGSTLSHHLDTLASCGLAAARRDGRFIHYAIDWGTTGELLRFLVEDCCAGSAAPSGPERRPAANPKRRLSTRKRRNHP